MIAEALKTGLSGPFIRPSMRELAGQTALMSRTGRTTTSPLTW